MSRDFDPRLYAIVDVGPAGLEVALDRVAAAVSGGVTLIQVRGKLATGRALYHAARELRGLLDPLGIPLIVNDRPDVARAAGARGVHLGQRDLPAAAARRFWPDGVIGVSVHTTGELEAARSAGVDYMAAGSLFPTGSKADATPLEHPLFAALARESQVPLIGIGGITAENAAAVVALGARGIAVIRGLWEAGDARARARDYRRALAEGGVA